MLRRHVVYGVPIYLSIKVIRNRPIGSFCNCELGLKFGAVRRVRRRCEPLMRVDHVLESREPLEKFWVVFDCDGSDPT